MGIEPTSAAWEAAVLPLDDTRETAIITPFRRFENDRQPENTFQAACHYSPKSIILMNHLYTTPKISRTTTL